MVMIVTVNASCYLEALDCAATVECRDALDMILLSCPQGKRLDDASMPLSCKQAMDEERKYPWGKEFLDCIITSDGLL